MNFKYITNLYHKYIKRTKCDEDCFHYGIFGGAESCEALDSWGSIHESIEPGQICLHPDKKEFGIDLGCVSAIGVCALLEGAVIVGGKNDNTNLVQLLTGSQVQTEK